MIQSSTTPDPGTTWESNKNTINITNKSLEVSRFPVGDHKVAMKRRKSMRNTRHKKIQMIHKRSTALEQSVKYFTGGLKAVSQCQPRPYFRCRSRHIDVWLARKTPSLSMHHLQKHKSSTYLLNLVILAHTL